MAGNQLLTTTSKNWSAVRGGFDSLFTSKTEQTEFAKFFQTKKITVQKDGEPAQEMTLWRLLPKAFNTVGQYYIQLPGLKQALDKNAKLSINSGIVLQPEFKDDQVKQDVLDEFLTTIPDGQLDFLNNVMRHYKTYSNCLITLLDTTPDQKSDKVYQWAIIPANQFGIVCSSNDFDLSQYNRKMFVMIKSDGTLVELPSEYTIYLHPQPSSVMAVPNLLFSNMLSEACIQDLKKIQKIKENGGYKKQIISGVKYANDETSTEAESKKRVADLANDVQKAITNPNKPVHFTNATFEAINELSPLHDDEIFIKYNSIYSTHIAHLSGLNAQKMTDGKNVNRSNTEQSDKEFYQYEILPNNNMLTKLVQKMMEIWAGLYSKEIVEITVQTPNQENTVSKNGADIINLLKVGALDYNEARQFFGLDPSDEYKDKVYTEPIKTPQV